MTEPDTYTRRTKRLAEELEDDAGVRSLSAIELEELAYACFVPVHERRAPSYGAIIGPTEILMSQLLPKELLGGPAVCDIGGLFDIHRARLFADGRTSFLARVDDDKEALLLHELAFGDELTLARLSDAGLTVVQRTASGVVRLVRRQRISTRESGHWWAKPTASAYRPAILRYISDLRAQTASAILDFCVHVLSPANVGATIVFTVTPAFRLAMVDYSKAFTPHSALNVLDTAASGALRNALAQLDRACIVNTSGVAEWMGVQLRWSAESEGITAPGGTRHASAARFSADERMTLVFVVSEDGPVTVFYGGDVIASTAQATWTEEVEEPCPLCGANGEKDLTCKVCHGRGSTLTNRVVTQRFEEPTDG